MEEIKLGKIEKLIIHYVGNKNNGDGVSFSEDFSAFEGTEELLENMVTNCLKSEEIFQFYFEPTLDLNPVYQFAKSIFQRLDSFVEQSKNIARYLYDNSTHPHIKGGELCLIFIKDCQIGVELVDCIGLFKSENKDAFLKVNPTPNGFDLKDEKGINPQKLDKGCLVFSMDKEDGFVVYSLDNTNRTTEARYWRDDFLSIQPQKNDYQQTNQFLGITKQFVTKQLGGDVEYSKTDQIDLLNRSVEFFKTHETFEKEAFEKEVFQDSELINSFRSFDQKYRSENELNFSDNFEISSKAVKKQARVFKSVLKLDKNFQIYIHGDRKLIEKGVERDGRKFYKIYYQEES
ncbi:MAG: nucleoid-associated protein [Bacteroidia bacterium]|nr:nucleoid-associated protein [Bacteroidia bacterium]